MKSNRATSPHALACGQLTLDVRVKRRNKDKRESLLDTLTEEETYELEKIARNLCVVHNISIEEALSLKNFRIN